METKEIIDAKKDLKHFEERIDEIITNDESTEAIDSSLYSIRYVKHLLHCKDIVNQSILTEQREKDRVEILNDLTICPSCEGHPNSVYYDDEGRPIGCDYCSNSRIVTLKMYDEFVKATKKLEIDPNDLPY